MNEVSRLQYLQALGVESYIPVRVLPGALPSVLCEWPSEFPVFSSDSDGSSIIKDKAPAAVQSADKVSLNRLQQDLSPQRKTTASQTAVVANNVATNVVAKQAVADPVTAASESSALLHLALFQPVKDLLILVPAPHTDHAHLQLLRNILLALGVKVQGVSPADNFIWPPRVKTGIKIDSSFAAAQETLYSWLEGHQIKTNAEQLLVFAGEMAEKWFPPALCPQQQLGKLRVYALPDLQQMLTDGRHKKTTWERIRHLSP